MDIDKTRDYILQAVKALGYVETLTAAVEDDGSSQIAKGFSILLSDITTVDKSTSSVDRESLTYDVTMAFVTDPSKYGKANVQLSKDARTAKDAILAFTLQDQEELEFAGLNITNIALTANSVGTHTATFTVLFNSIT